MLSMIHSECRKLTTIPSPWLLLAAGPLVVITGVTGLVMSNANVRDPAVQSEALAYVGLAAIFTLVFGILAVAGEYRHGTITDTYLSFPERGRAVAAKLAVYSLVGAAAGLVSSLAALAAVATWWSAKGGALHLSAADTWRTLGGGVGVNVAFAASGVSLGALIRNLAGAIAATLAWIALIEGIAGQLLGSGLARWQPFYASQALDQAAMSASPQLLQQWAGGLVLLGYAAAFSAAAVVVTLKRDVT